MIKKYISKISICIILVLFLCCGICMNAEAKRDVVIVIDPGHGGTNMGARHNGVIEKEATMKVALAMKDELEKYEGVTVYLTRTGDDSMELIDRAEFARDVKADIILSLHFNMSELHDLHGSEMWISSEPALKVKAENFAKIEQMLLKEYGIDKRGCFTRLNDLGTDYYGVIRESATFNIPAVIVEHCYLDRPEEYQFYDTDAALDRLGRIDATAVAMTYRLSSEELGVDYSRHYVSNTKLPENLLDEDTTPPTDMELEIENFNEDTNEMKLRLKVAENESILTHYQYSFDGGKTFSDKKPFYTETEISFTTQVYPSVNDDFMVRAYNAYGLYTDSEIFQLNELLFVTEEEPEQNNIVIVFVTQMIDEFVDFTEELSPETQAMAKTVLIIGFVFGIGATCLLVFRNKTKAKPEDYESEAKGA